MIGSIGRGNSLRASAALVLSLLLVACNGSSTSSDLTSSATAAAATTTAALTDDSAAADSSVEAQRQRRHRGDPIAFSASSVSVAQSAGTVSLTVTRTGSADSAVSVDYATTDGTAAAGSDYTATTGTLNWAENDSTSKTVTVPISNASPYATSKVFQVLLSDPSSGAHIASPGAVTVTITGDATAAIGNVELSAASYSVAQNAGAVTVSVSRVGGASGAISVAFHTANGTATAGTDYTATSGVLEWADGDASSKNFSVDVSNTTPFTGSKTFTVALTTPRSGTALVTPNSATVSIVGDASTSTGSVQLSSTSYAVAQNAGKLAVSVKRMGSATGAVSVTYATANGTAVAGTDYTAANGTLSWANGDSTAKTFSVAINNGTPFTGSKAFRVALANPSTGASISNPGSATATIAGTATAAVGTIELSASSYAVAQSAGSVILTVDRVGGSSGAVSASFHTADGTAVAGTDYTATSGTLNWADGDTSAKTVTVVVSDSTPFSGKRSFTVALSSGTTGTTLSSPSSAAVTISGSAAAAIGSVQLSSSSYSVAQSAGSFKVTVNRTGGSSGAVTVGYATAGGTAVSGTDFTATSGTLSWADGDAASKTFSVAVSNATAFTGTKSFTIALASATGGATLSSPITATVGITGSGATSSSSTSTFWVYHNGTFNWGGDYSTAGTPNYKSTAGSPESGSYDIAFTLTGNWGIWAPYAGGTVPMWDFNSTGYNYLIMDLKPTVANQVWQFYFMQVGDVQIVNCSGQQIMVDPTKYGPAPVVGQWATYKIPLTDVLTQCSSGKPVLETGVYKFGLQDESGRSSNTWYIDNVGFTP